MAEIILLFSATDDISSSLFWMSAKCVRGWIETFSMSAFEATEYLRLSLSWFEL